MTLKRMLIATSAVLCMQFAPFSARADSAKDFETLSKAIGFLNGGPSGDVEMAIVYDPSNADSAAHADEVAGLTSGGVGSGKVKLVGKKVDVGSVGSTGSAIIFMTKGTSGAYGAALDKASANGGITVSTDLGCLDAGGCVLVVKTEPSVDIFVSTAASGKSGAEFASAFSMMITKK